MSSPPRHQRMTSAVERILASSATSAGPAAERNFTWVPRRTVIGGEDWHSPGAEAPGLCAPRGVLLSADRAKGVHLAVAKPGVVTSPSLAGLRRAVVQRREERVGRRGSRARHGIGTVVDPRGHGTG